jgi:type II restriction/modification system DNA methylase subunit YeeA
VVDFSENSSEAVVAQYEAPFEYIRKHVLPERLGSAVERNQRLWWLHHRSRPELRKAVDGKSRYIATPVVSKHRFFVWLSVKCWPSNLLDAVARDDDTTFGVLHSKLHEVWALRMGTWLGVGNDPRYTPSTTFETFPFPEGLTPNIPADDYADDSRAQAIAEAARKLDELREAWLNPADLVVREPEVVSGYPDRILPKDEDAAKVLKTRTLTNLYNQRPAWLDMAHKALDGAVAAAYGWPADLSDDDILERLFALNQARAAAGR